MDNHHALLLYADTLQESVLPEAYKHQSADVLHFTSERFSIDNARELIRVSLQTPVEGTKRIFVIAAQHIAVEAQNALLKLLEEPPLHAQFFIILPSSSMLLPTLRSRLSVQDAVRSGHKKVSEIFTIFKGQTYAERLVFIADITKNKNAEMIEAIVSGCEQEASLNPQAHAELLRATVFVRRYLGSKGSSVKMLLEDLALTLH